MPRHATSTSYGGKQGNTPKGNDPSRPGPGVPPQTFRDRMRLLASRQETVSRLERSLENEDDAVFLKAFGEVANRGYGKAPESVEHSGEVAMRVEIVREGKRRK